MPLDIDAILRDAGQELRVFSSEDRSSDFSSSNLGQEKDYLGLLIRAQANPLIVVENSPLTEALRSRPTLALVVPELHRDAILAPDGIFVCAIRPGGPECAHYHKRQWETYMTLTGEFSMRSRWRWDEKWQPAVACPPGTIVIVRPQVVHKLTWKTTDGLCVVHRAPPDPTDKVVVEE